MEQVTCNTCGYYHRHYVLSEGRIIQIHCGIVLTEEFSGRL